LVLLPRSHEKQEISCGPPLSPETNSSAVWLIACDQV